MIRQRDKFSAAEFFYAIDFSTIQIQPGYENHGTGTVDAIWFKKKNGVIAACYGTLRASGTAARPLHNEADFMFHYDGRYGGNTMYKWDGTEMWGSNNNFLELVEAHKFLDPIRNGFPNIPDGYTGWYSIK